MQENGLFNLWVKEGVETDGVRHPAQHEQKLVTFEPAMLSDLRGILVLWFYSLLVASVVLLFEHLRKIRCNDIRCLLYGCCFILLGIKRLLRSIC